MSTQTAIPDDFPRAPVGAVGGAHPKVLARKVDGRYVAGWTEAELLARYESCADLVQQFTDYCRRKATQNPDWTMEFNVNRAMTGLDQRIANGEWDVTASERDWIAAKLRTQFALPSDERGT